MTVDKVLESCFQLLSLFFLTIGRTSEAPAAYALTSTIKRLLDHLTESSLFSAKDLESMSHTLERLESIVKNSESKHSPYLVELLAKRVELCKESLANLQTKLDHLGEPLPAIHEKLISILRSMSLANTKAKVRCYQPYITSQDIANPRSKQFSTTEVQKLQAQLKEIDESRVDGKFLGPDGSPAAGGDEVADLLERCLQWSDIVLERYVC
jgi:hypothetical protein